MGKHDLNLPLRFQRKRKLVPDSRPITCMYVLLYTGEKKREIQNTMVDNPLYEGPIYEVVSEHKKLKALVPKTKVHAQESLYLDSPTQSLPRDAGPSYDAINGVMVKPNASAGSKEYTGCDVNASKVNGTCVNGGLEISLDQPQLYTNPNTTCSPTTEDAYTIMCPVTPVASITCHTNYHATSNGRLVNGRYVSQQQVTLV